MRALLGDVGWWGREMWRRLRTNGLRWFLLYRLCRWLDHRGVLPHHWPGARTCLCGTFVRLPDEEPRP